MKLNPPHRSSPPQSSPVRAVGTAWTDSTAEMVDGPPHVDEQVGDVIMHCRCQPPALLSQLGVVCYGLLHLLLLCAKGGDLGREVGKAPHYRVLIIEACRCRRTHLWNIGWMHTYGVVGSLITSIPTAAGLERARAAIGIVSICLLEAHVLSRRSRLRSSGGRGCLA